jgi:RND family efflux transporter MFP subunit
MMSDESVRRRIRTIAWAVLVVAVVLAAWGIFDRLAARESLAKRSADAAISTVLVVSPTSAGKAASLELPANVQAYTDAPIYARTNGYLKRRLVDIGAHVKQGQLLAEIDAPEVDQQIHQAEADLATAEANDALAQSTAQRWKEMLPTDSVAKQDVDEKMGDAAAKHAALASARANLARVRQLGSFERILAPFDGTITARSTDIGALVTAGSGPSAGEELFHIASIDKLRVYVSVPQPYAPFIKNGGRAELRVSEMPGQVFQAKILNTSEAIDERTRTLLTQLEVDNAKSAIRPGSYGEVRFQLPVDQEALRVPVNALLFRSDGMKVASVDANSRLVIKSITVGRDMGREVEVLAGVGIHDRLVLNPPDSAVDGMLVRVQPRAIKQQP